MELSFLTYNKDSNFKLNKQYSTDFSESAY